MKAFPKISKEAKKAKILFSDRLYINRTGGGLSESEERAFRKGYDQGMTEGKFQNSAASRLELSCTQTGFYPDRVQCKIMSKHKHYIGTQLPGFGIPEYIVMDSDEKIKCGHHPAQNCDCYD